MTLTEFLLGRIAEDEAGLMERSIENVPSDCWGPERVGAECEAKRRIVEMHPLRDGYCDGCGIEVQHADGCLNLRHLAAVYADHPDYDEAWRP